MTCAVPQCPTRASGRRALWHAPETRRRRICREEGRAAGGAMSAPLTAPGAREQLSRAPRVAQTPTMPARRPPHSPSPGPSPAGTASGPGAGRPPDTGVPGRGPQCRTAAGGTLLLVCQGLLVRARWTCACRDCRTHHIASRRLSVQNTVRTVGRPPVARWIPLPRRPGPPVRQWCWMRCASKGCADGAWSNLPGPQGPRGGLCRARAAGSTSVTEGSGQDIAPGTLWPYPSRPSVQT